MKTLKQIREKSDLLEMEIFTHKKKIAAAREKLKAVQQKHADASKKHFDLANAAHAKTDEKLPNSQRLAHNSVRSHVIKARYHKDAAKADVHDHRHAPTYGNGNWMKKHISSKDVKHSEKLHKELVGAHAAHSAALKKSPQQKLKRAVGMSEMKSSEVGRDDLKDGGRNRNHNGHEGGAAYHKSMADEHKGTAAGKLHAKAADHHSNALAALNKGNISSSHEHSKLAAATAKKAQAAGGAKSDSSEVHYSHSQHYRHHQRNQTTQNIKNKEKRAGVQDKPVQRAIGKIKSKVKKAFQREESTSEGYVSMAQQRAVWASRKDGGKGHPDNKRKRKKEDVDETWQTISRGPGYKIQKDSDTGQKRRVADVKEQDSDAVKAFLAKGGKIKKLPPAKAQGYHGRDDPGKDMHGMMDRPDTKQMGTRKKVKSMEANQVDEISKDTKKRYIKKSADDMSRQADRMARAQRGDGKMDKAVNKFVNRRKGIARALEAKETDPPFDDAKKISTTPAKDQFGNIIKNRAKHLARQAAKKAAGDMGDKK